MPEINIEQETTDLESYWRERNIRMEEDRAMVNLIKPEQTTGKLRWISNEPKVFYDTSIALVSSYPPRFRLPLTINYTPEQKDKMDKAERFLLGIFRGLDARQMDRGQTYWLRDLAYWVLSGWYAIFNIVRKGERGVEFIADLWDPMHVYPEWDADGLIKCIRSFEVDRETANAMVYGWQLKGLKTKFKMPGRETSVKIINYWRKDMGKRGKAEIRNAITVAGQSVKPLTIEPLFDHIPIHIGSVGSPEMGSTGWKTRRGEHIIAANRDMYEYTNIILQLMVTIMAETAYPNLVSQTKGAVGVTKGEGLKGYAEEIRLQPGEQIELLKHAATPEEALQALQYLLKQQQKGSLPDIVYGGVPVELSGFAISQLMAAIKYKIAPYLNTMQYAASRVSSSFLVQYKRSKFPKIELSTFNPKAEKKGLFFVEEFSREDVPDATYVDVAIPITSALDKTQQILFSRQALQPPQLISRETLWDEVLEIQDSEQEYARIIQDEILELPVVKQIAAIEQLRKRVAFYRNQEPPKEAEARALEKYIMMMEMQLGMRQGIPTKPGETPPPQFSPPEAGASPDMGRAALGVPPPGLSRRPQTADERAESQGKGRLVSPTGQPLL